MSETRGTLAGLLSVLGIGLFLACPAIVGWQVYQWLRLGVWVPISALWALASLEVQWALLPDWATSRRR